LVTLCTDTEVMARSGPAQVEAAARTGACVRIRKPMLKARNMQNYLLKVKRTAGSIPGGILWYSVRAPSKVLVPRGTVPMSVIASEMPGMANPMTR
jgi:hypothetical protein